jgi:hypothetical protein
MSAGELFELLPAILRVRDHARAQVTPGLLAPPDRTELAGLDAKQTAGMPLTAAEEARLSGLREQSLAGPLASLLALFDEQIAVLREDLDQLYDDQFIETCAEWITPYIGDLIAYRALHGVVPAIASPRAEVAHTIGYRRRKGTVSVLEQLAQDVTGWNARAAEFFSQLIVTQYMNHLRPWCLAAPDLRGWEPLERLGTAFNSVAHTVDVRHIANRRGRYNIPNVGIFLWRLTAYPLSRSPAVRLDDRRRRFHPLGIDQPLVTRPATMDQTCRLATPRNVPAPISRRVLDAYRADYYTDVTDITRSLRLYENSSGTFEPVPGNKIRSCDLADDGAGWAHLPTDDTYAVDAVLGRIATPAALPGGTELRVDFHYGFSGDVGGGEYERAASFETRETPPRIVRVPDDKATIQQALDDLGGAGVVEITDSGRYEETLGISVAANRWIELRAANQRRPTLVLGDKLTLTGGERSQVRLNGLLIAGQALHVPAAGNALAALKVSHCTLVPGLTLAADGTPLSPDAPSLLAEQPGLAITITRSILGGLRVEAGAEVAASDSIIDATARSLIAYAAPDELGAGGALRLDGCTTVGKVHALKLMLVTNSIMLAELAAADAWTAPIIAARRQEGCVRFSHVPIEARVPRRYRCLPDPAAPSESSRVRFTSLRYGFAAYGQLATDAGSRLLTGADDGNQPGALHFLFQAQRETNLRVRLDEYLRAGLEAGLFHAN